eukprot:snap_masked-scaffold_69-processed-gene-0.34-mRNA-1 protein AED:1.00 eAED:1.00 QI:0/-1/0/0/-1/1/1/0/131
MRKLHNDMVGSLPTSIRKFRYFVIIVYSFSNFVMTVLAKCKEDIAENHVNMVKKRKTQFKGRINCIFTDNGTEFVKLFQYAQTEGIKVENSPPYMSIKMGKVEKHNTTVFSSERAMLAQADVSPSSSCYAT